MTQVKKISDYASGSQFPYQIVTNPKLKPGQEYLIGYPISQQQHDDILNALVNNITDIQQVTTAVDVAAQQAEVANIAP